MTAPNGEAGQPEPTDAPPQAERFAFGEFSFDPRTHELKREGKRVHLPLQPAVLLNLLLENAGELVTRDEIRRRLWPEGTHVEADLGINASIRRVRRALGDTSSDPRFVETLAGQGYRFCHPVERRAGQPGAPPPPAGRRTRRAPVLWSALLLLLAALVAGLLALRAGRSGSREVRTAGGRSRLAVGLLTDLSEGSLPGSVPAGLREDLLTVLAQRLGARLDVAAEPPASQPSAPPPDYVLTGAVREVTGGLVITLRLLDSAETFLWAQRFELPDPRPASWQVRWANDVAEELGARLRLTDPLGAPPGIPVAAYERYLSGLYLLWTLPALAPAREDEMRGQVQQALGLFESAVADAPGFADAWAALARAHMWTSSWLPPSAYGPPAIEAAQRAVEADPTSAAGHAALASLLLETRYDWEGAARHAELAVRAGPDVGAAQRAQASVLAAAGALDEALAAIDRARDIDPLNPTYALESAYLRLLAGRWRESTAETERLLLARPAHPLLHLRLVRLALLQRDEVLAVARANRFLEISGYQPVTSSQAYWQGTRDYLQHEATRRPLAPWWLALADVHLGRRREAAAILLASCRDRSSQLLPFAHLDPDLKLLQGLPDYEAAIACVGMPAPGGGADAP